MKKPFFLACVVIFLLWAVWFLSYLIRIASVVPPQARISSQGSPDASTSIALNKGSARALPKEGYSVAPNSRHRLRYDVEANARLDESGVLEDHAGIWQNFGPGPGNINRDPADWKWTLVLQLPDTLTIKYMVMTHNLAGEGWSTSLQAVYGKTPYPLVVFYRGRQLNTVYDQPLGTYYAGTHEFTLYAQKESAVFSGAALTVVFADYSSVSVDIVKPNTPARVEPMRFEPVQAYPDIEPREEPVDAQPVKIKKFEEEPWMQ